MTEINNKIICTYNFSKGWAQFAQKMQTDGVNLGNRILLQFIKTVKLQIQRITRMRRSCHEQNRKMLQAYNLYKAGNLPQSLQIYQSILQHTSNQQLRHNITCTIGIISTTLGNYNYALQLLEHNLANTHTTDMCSLVKVRYSANLCFVYIVMGMYDEAVQMFRDIKNVIVGDENIQQLLQFLFVLFFRVSSLEDICKETVIPHSPTLLQAYYMLNLAFAKDICGVEGSQQLLKTAYPIFVAHNKLHLAIVCLRQLLLLPLCNKDTIKYEKQMSKIMSMDVMENFELDNVESIECCKLIAQQLVQFYKQLNLAKKDSKQNGNFDQRMWALVLKYQNKKLIGNSLIAEEQREALNKNIEMMLQQENTLVINEMKKTDFYLNAQRQINNVLTGFTSICERHANLQLRWGFKKIIESKTQRIDERSLLKNRSYTQLEAKKMDKENRMPLTLARDKSSKSLMGEKSKSRSKLQEMPSNRDDSRYIYKALKFCEYGSFLSKRNFNSDGGEYRFVRVTQAVLKWAKNPEKIEESCQLYPLKDIHSITYGKCTPTLLKNSNHLLKDEYCFSLKLMKRTLDFYCKDYEQACNWVCGLTLKLKQINPQFRGYTRGKILWKRMFMIMKQNFTSKIKPHQRKFYYETAQAVILFGKNDYKLPLAK